MRRTVALASLLLAAALVAVGCASEGSDAASGDATSSDAAPAGDEATTSAPEVVAAAEGEVADAAPEPSAGCGTSTVGSVVDEQQHLDDSDRWWLLRTPLDHDGETPLPVIVDFHGLSEGAEIHAKMSELGPFADEHGIVLVTPQGTGTPVRWQATLDVDGDADQTFVAAMLDQLEAELCLDLRRVYATGLSNGAMMTSTVACTMADRFAAVAPVAGVTASDACDPARPVPMLAFHGTADPILLFNGGVGDSLNSVLGGGDVGDIDVTDVELPEPDLRGEGYPAAAQARAELNGCEGEGTDTEVTDTVIRRVWDCPEGADTEFWIIEGGGHTWPGSSFSANLEKVMGPTELDVSANETMWAFFGRFALPA